MEMGAGRYPNSKGSAAAPVPKNSDSHWGSLDSTCSICTLGQAGIVALARDNMLETGQEPMAQADSRSRGNKQRCYGRRKDRLEHMRSSYQSMDCCCY